MPIRNDGRIVPSILPTYLLSLKTIISTIENTTVAIHEIIEIRMFSLYLYSYLHFCSIYSTEGYMQRYTNNTITRGVSYSIKSDTNSLKTATIISTKKANVLDNA